MRHKVQQCMATEHSHSLLESKDTQNCEASPEDERVIFKYHTKNSFLSQLRDEEGAEVEKLQGKKAKTHLHSNLCFSSRGIELLLWFRWLSLLLSTSSFFYFYSFFCVFPTAQQTKEKQSVRSFLLARTLLLCSKRSVPSKWN